MTHTRIAPLAALLACTAATTLTACDNKTPTPTPSATTTAPITAIPTPVGSTTASTSTGALYTQAVAVYRKNFDGFVALAKQGGLAMSAPTPAVMTETLTGEALTKQLNELHNEKLKHFEYVSGTPTIKWVKPSTTEHVGANVGVESCEDASPMINRVNGKQIRGAMILRKSWYAVVNGKVKMVEYTAEKTSSCAA